MSLSALGTQQAKPREQTMTNTKQLLDYVGSQEEAILTYLASDMILAAHSDASYLSEPEASSFPTTSNTHPTTERYSQ